MIKYSIFAAQESAMTAVALSLGFSACSDDEKELAAEDEN